MKQFSFFDENGKLLFTGDANECAEHFHYNVSYIYRLAKTGGGQMKVVCDDTACHRRRLQHRVVYTVYNRYDDVICTGTADECVNALGLKNTSSFYSILTKSKRGKLQKYRFESGYVTE